MGYATNRYFQPAKYTPIISEVEMPFKEMFLAGQERQKAQDVLKKDIASVGVNDSKILREVTLPDGSSIHNTHFDRVKSEEHMFDQGASAVANAIAGGSISSLEAQNMMNGITSKSKELYGEYGAFGVHDKAAKDYETVQKAIADIPDIKEHPWSALEAYKNLKDYGEGKIDYIDPYAIGKATTVDWPSEINKIMDKTASEGYAYDASSGMYISIKSGNQITPQKVKQTFEAGFNGSRLEADMLRKREYNEMTKGSDYANQVFEEDYTNAMKSAMKITMFDPNMTKSVDRYKMALRDEELVKEGVRTYDHAATPVVQHQVNNSYGITSKDVYQYITTGKMTPAVQDLSKDVDKFFANADQSIKNLSTKDKVKIYATAIKNGSQLNIDYNTIPNEKVKGYYKSELLNDPDRMVVVASGPNAGQKIKASELPMLLGYTNYQTMIKDMNVSGVAGSDPFNTGAGSRVVKLVAPRFGNVTTDVIVSANERDRNIYGASGHFSQALMSGKPKAYYAYGIKNGQVDVDSGYAVDQDPRKSKVPYFIEQTGTIENPQSPKDAKIVGEIKVWMIQPDGTYKAIQQYTPKEFMDMSHNIGLQAVEKQEVANMKLRSNYDPDAE